MDSTASGRRSTSSLLSTSTSTLSRRASTPTSTGTRVYPASILASCHGSSCSADSSQGILKVVAPLRVAKTSRIPNGSNANQIQVNGMLSALRGPQRRW